MKSHAVLLPLAVFFAFASAHTTAAASVPSSWAAKVPNPARETPLLKRSLPDAPHGTPASQSHLFTVSDVKGLVLTCVAPELDANVDTDVFKSCTLAPGRTLEEVMHVFVQGIHYEQSQFQKEREEWQRGLEERATQKAAQKP